MKIGIIGSGVVAQTLGAGFLKHGHEVALGTREPAKLADWAAANPGAKVVTFAEAARLRRGHRARGRRRGRPRRAEARGRRAPSTARW